VSGEVGVVLEQPDFLALGQLQVSPARALSQNALAGLFVRDELA
jgi:hypothetical protein